MHRLVNFINTLCVGGPLHWCLHPLGYGVFSLNSGPVTFAIAMACLLLMQAMPSARHEYCLEGIVRVRKPLQLSGVYNFLPIKVLQLLLYATVSSTYRFLQLCLCKSSTDFHNSILVISIT